MPELNEVFGIGTDIPKFTYVDRSGLDTKFGYLLKTQRHIVLHGASKQGKSCLRKKKVDESACIVVQCLPGMTSKDLWQKALSNMDVKITHEINFRRQLHLGIEGGATGTVGIPILVKAETSAKGELSGEVEQSTSKKPVGGHEEDIRYLAQQLHAQNKRLILEDFHYLSEETRKEVAFHLKALYELNVFVIIIGIWAEQNLLTYYNGDLTGRIEEVNISWLDSELLEVLNKGELALNILFSDAMKQEMIAASFENVGLLQRIAERTCFVSNVLKTQPTTTPIDSIDALKKAINDIVQDIQQRYNRIFEVFDRGFRAKTELKVYYNIFKVISHLSDQELINGVPTATILTEIKKTSPNIRQSDLTQSLERIERLQSTRNITPLLASYNQSLRSVSLTDREFLFFRKYGKMWDFDTDTVDESTTGS